MVAFIFSLNMDSIMGEFMANNDTAGLKAFISSQMDSLGYSIGKQAQKETISAILDELKPQMSKLVDKVNKLNETKKK